MSLPVAGPSSPVAAKNRLPKSAVAKAGPSRSATTKAGAVKPAITPVVADYPVVIATPIAFPANVLQESEVGMIEVLSSALSQESLPIMHWNPHDKEFFITQVQAAQAATGAPVASDSGSNEDDDVPMSKQHMLDSDSDDSANEHCHKKQYNANAKQLLAINAEKAKLDLKHLNDTMPGCLPDSWETIIFHGCYECQDKFRGILHPNFYWSPMTNVVFVGDKAVFAHSTEMAGYPVYPCTVSCYIGGLYKGCL
ncbi:hypothetical protein C0989_007045 [Termitomyces sp. Mn162]|nr:hypothetical protein C0989_007045 [Termitomyces sp. Mn162]